MGGRGSGAKRRKRAKELREPAWERQPHESHKAFAAFKVYLELRGLHLTAKELAKSYALVSRWSSMWRWIDRTVAYDNEIQRIEMEQQAAARVEMRKRHLNFALGLQTLGGDQLKKWIEHVQSEANAGRDLSAKDVQAIIDAGVRLERLNRGDAESVTEEREVVSFAELARKADEGDDG